MDFYGKFGLLNNVSIYRLYFAHCQRSRKLSVKQEFGGKVQQTLFTVCSYKNIFLLFLKFKIKQQEFIFKQEDNCIYLAISFFELITFCETWIKPLIQMNVRKSVFSIYNSSKLSGCHCKHFCGIKIEWPWFFKNSFTSL